MRTINYLFFSLLLAGSFIAASKAHAQLCNGSLGDPVVSITFGNGNENSGYAPTNAYQYTSSTCPSDGYYTITKNTSQCFGNTWHTITNDHTGGGAFMLVNASVEPGDFFVATVTDLCPNTDYEFAAWIMNVMNQSAIQPDITFSIETPDGTVLQNFSTGDIHETTQPQWTQYGFYFTTPSDNPVIVLRMKNNAPGGNGNDLALDDITFRPCGPVIQTTIQGNTDTVNICKGNTTVYTMTADASSEYISPAFQWQISTDTGHTWQDIPGATVPVYTRQPTGTGLYQYRVAVTEETAVNIISCRIASNAITIHIHDEPFVDAGENRISIAGDTIHIEGMVKGEDPVYYWSPTDYLESPNNLKTIASPVQSLRYTLYAESAFGCKSQDTVSIKVVTGIFVPSAFTPNNDGKNDHWRIPFLDPAFNATVSIFNRYGQMVYHVKGKTVDWNGTYNGREQPVGTYIYLIRFTDGRRADMKGTVTLIR